LAVIEGEGKRTAIYLWYRIGRSAPLFLGLKAPEAFSRRGKVDPDLFKTDREERKA